MQSASRPPADIATQRHLLIIHDAQGNRALLLKGTRYSLGRDPVNDISISSQFVSRRHALLLRLPSETQGCYRYRIMDGDLEGRSSANGLVVNHTRVRSHELNNGDRVVLAPDTSLTYFILNGEGALGIPPVFERTVLNLDNSEEPLPLDEEVAAEPQSSSSVTGPLQRFWQSLRQWLPLS